MNRVSQRDDSLRESRRADRRIPRHTPRPAPRRRPLRGKVPPRPLGPHPVERGSVRVPVRDPSGPYVECKVSPEDYALAMSHPWRLNADGYVIVHVYDVVRKKSTLLSLHRMVARAPAGVLVDHVRANLLDCRRCALRRATHSQNTANRRKLLPNKSSRYRGVTKHKGGRWQAAAKHHDKCIHGGLHDTQEQAAAAYNAIARRIWGRFSVLNRLPAKHGGAQ